jgi:hypothetical protein
LTLKQKYHLVQEAEKKAKPTQKELGIKFGIGKTTPTFQPSVGSFKIHKFKISDKFHCLFLNNWSV